MAYTETLKAV